jgi:hypothetical protein
MEANKVAEARELAQQKRQVAANAAEIANTTKNCVSPKLVETLVALRGSLVPVALRGSMLQVVSEELSSPTAQESKLTLVTRGGSTSEVTSKAQSMTIAHESSLMPAVAKFALVALNTPALRFQLRSQAPWWPNWAPPKRVNDIDRAGIYIDKASN